MARNGRKWTTPPSRRPKYILRNIHPKKMDVMLGDLYYRIPYGQSRDLLSPTAHLDPAAIERSRLNGSIAKRIAQGLIVEVQAVVLATPPTVSIASPSAVSFPQRTKTLAVPENEDLIDSIRSTVMDMEDEELLRQMEEEEKSISDGEAAGLPVSIDPNKAAAVLDKVSGSCCGKKKK